MVNKKILKDCFEPFKHKGTNLLNINFSEVVKHPAMDYFGLVKKIKANLGTWKVILSVTSVIRQMWAVHGTVGSV